MKGPHGAGVVWTARAWGPGPPSKEEPHGAPPGLPTRSKRGGCTSPGPAVGGGRRWLGGALAPRGRLLCLARALRTPAGGALGPGTRSGAGLPRPLSVPGVQTAGGTLHGGRGRAAGSPSLAFPAHVRFPGAAPQTPERTCRKSWPAQMVLKTRINW